MGAALPVALTGTTLIAAWFTADVSVRLRRVATVVTVAAFVTALSTLGLDRSAEATAAVLSAGLVALAPVAIARAVFRRRVVDVQTVLALTIYVLLGMFWAFVYSVLGALDRSPFLAQPGTPTTADYLCFSSITLTTVGYHDLSAATNPGRACAVPRGTHRPALPRHDRRRRGLPAQTTLQRRHAQLVGGGRRDLAGSSTDEA